ncbi:MAG: hypothetical protein E7628_06695 [Ruminococcaceae bacterium]|nr:hypothetical protein [Oscillospiraceae bacterium]
MCAIIAIVSLFTVLPTDIYAWDDMMISETLNIAEANKNKSGPGYNWANRTSELTLSGVNIYTDSAYGLRLPKDCTVILEGDNYIRAEKYGISCAGTVTFKGNGTLTIDAGKIGIYLISQNNTHKIRLIEGKYSITAGEYGVYSEAADFSFVGKSVDITVKNADGLAISGRSVNLIGGSFKANSSVVASRELVVDSIDLDISSSAPVFTSPILKIDNIKIDGADEYTNQTSLKAKATARFHLKSIILGDKYPGWVDYIILGAVLIIAASAIIIPLIRKKKKAKKLFERLKTEGYIDEN